MNVKVIIIALKFVIINMDHLIVNARMGMCCKLMENNV